MPVTSPSFPEMAVARTRSAASTARVISARTTPYSAIVCPSSRPAAARRRWYQSRRPISLLSVVETVLVELCCGRARCGVGLARRMRELRRRQRAREHARDVAELSGDRDGQQPESEHDADRDHRQDDAVLGHRLTLLALHRGAEQ